MENGLENLHFRLHLFWWRFIYIWIGVSFIQDTRYIKIFTFLYLFVYTVLDSVELPNQFSYNSAIEISLRSLVVEILTNKVLNLNMKLNVQSTFKSDLSYALLISLPFFCSITSVYKNIICCHMLSFGL